MKVVVLCMLEDNKEYEYLNKAAEMGCSGVFYAIEAYDGLVESVAKGLKGSIQWVISPLKGDTTDYGIPKVDVKDGFILDFLNDSTSETDGLIAHVEDMKTADTLVQTLLNKLIRDECIVYLIAGRLHKENTVEERKEFQLKDGRSLPVPMQSVTFMDNERVQPDLSWPMYYTSFGNGTTRKDKVNRFAYEEIKKLGGNGKLLINALGKELAFRCGKAAKYGA